MDLIYFYFII